MRSGAGEGKREELRLLGELTGDLRGRELLHDRGGRRALANRCASHKRTALRGGGGR